MYAREIRYKVDGPGTNETATGYVASPARYSTISVEDLADHISADSRVERSKVAVITDSLIKQIREMVLNGHKIEIPHLGSFKPKIKGGMAVSIEDIDAAAFNARVKFTPSMELKRELQSARIVKTEIPSAPASPTVEEVKASILASFPSEAKAYVKKNYPDSNYVLILSPNTQQRAALSVSQLVDKNTSTKNVLCVTVQCGFKVEGAPDTDKPLLITKIIAAKDEAGVYSVFDGEAILGQSAESVQRGVFEEQNATIDVISSFYKVPEPFTVQI